MNIFKWKNKRDVSMRAQAPLVDMTGYSVKKRDEVGGKAANLIPK